MGNHAKTEKEVVKHAKKILKELGINYRASKVLHFGRGLSEDICEAVNQLIDKKTQFAVYDDYEILVVKYEGKRPRKNTHDDIMAMFQFIDMPESWEDDYNTQKNYPDELVSKAWLQVYDKMKSVPKLDQRPKTF